MDNSAAFKYKKFADREGPVWFAAQCREPLIVTTSSGCCEKFTNEMAVLTLRIPEQTLQDMTQGVRRHEGNCQQQQDRRPQAAPDASPESACAKSDKLLRCSLPGQHLQDDGAECY